MSPPALHLGPVRQADQGSLPQKVMWAGGCKGPGWMGLVLRALYSILSLGSRQAVGAWQDQAYRSLPPQQVSSSLNMAVGADETTTWYSGTCVTTRRGPSPSVGAATGTSAPSQSECLGEERGT